MIHTITANEIKTRGVIAISEAISEGEDAIIISVRGQNRYVVLPIEKYNYLRECELEAAFYEGKNDLLNGNYTIESVDNHISRIKNG